MPIQGISPANQLIAARIAENARDGASPAELKSELKTALTGLDETQATKLISAFESAAGQSLQDLDLDRAGLLASLPTAARGGGGNAALAYLGAQAAVDGAGGDPLDDPRFAFAKERIMAHVGAGKRFGAIDGGEGGVRAYAFAGDAAADLVKAFGRNTQLGDDPRVIAVHTTTDDPVLLLAMVNDDGDKVNIVGERRMQREAKRLRGLSEPNGFAAIAKLMGDAPEIALGAGQPDWSLSGSDWLDRAGQRPVVPTDRLAVDAGATTPAELALSAIKNNAGDDARFDPLTSGNFGVRAHMVPADKAGALFELARDAYQNADKQELHDLQFDPDRHALAGVFTTESEPRLSVLLIDKDKGEVLDMGGHYDALTDAWMDTLPDGEIRQSFNTIHHFLAGGEELDLGNGDDWTLSDSDWNEVYE